MTKYNIQNAGCEILNLDGPIADLDEARRLAAEIEQDNPGTETHIAIVEDHPDGCSCGSPDCPQWAAGQELI